MKQVVIGSIVMLLIGCAAAPEPRVVQPEQTAGAGIATPGKGDAEAAPVSVQESPVKAPASPAPAMRVQPPPSPDNGLLGFARRCSGHKIFIKPSAADAFFVDRELKKFFEDLYFKSDGAFITPAYASTLRAVTGKRYDLGDAAFRDTCRRMGIQYCLVYSKTTDESLGVQIYRLPDTEGIIPEPVYTAKIDTVKFSGLRTTWESQSDIVADPATFTNKTSVLLGEALKKVQKEIQAQQPLNPRAYCNVAGFVQPHRDISMPQFRNRFLEYFRECGELTAPPTITDWNGTPEQIINVVQTRPGAYGLGFKMEKEPLAEGSRHYVMYYLRTVVYDAGGPVEHLEFLDAFLAEAFLPPPVPDEVATAKGAAPPQPSFQRLYPRMMVVICTPDGKVDASAMSARVALEQAFAEKHFELIDPHASKQLHDNTKMLLEVTRDTICAAGIAMEHHAEVIVTGIVQSRSEPAKIQGQHAASVTITARAVDGTVARVLATTEQTGRAIGTSRDNASTVAAQSAANRVTPYLQEQIMGWWRDYQLYGSLFRVTVTNVHREEDVKTFQAIVRSLDGITAFEQRAFGGGMLECEIKYRGSIAQLASSVHDTIARRPGFENFRTISQTGNNIVFSK